MFGYHVGYGNFLNGDVCEWRKGWGGGAGGAAEMDGKVHAW